MSDDPTAGQPDTPETRIARALHYAEYGTVDGAHHKQWVIDQMVRALTGCPYVEYAAADYRGEPYTYQGQGCSAEYYEWIMPTMECIGQEEWEGIAP